MTTTAQELAILRERLKKQGIAVIDEAIFQLTSLSDPTKCYVIDLTDINAHKSDCIAFRYGKKCNHLKRLEDNGFIEEKESS